MAKFTKILVKYFFLIKKRLIIYRYYRYGRVLTKGILICYNTLMNNKALKNLIVLGAFAVFILSASHALAYGEIPLGYNAINYNYVPAGNTVNYNTTPSQYNYAQQPVQQYNYVQPQTQYVQQQPAQQYNYVEQPYTYVAPQVKYVTQPAPTTITKIQYVPVETVKYVNTGTTVNTATSNQGASVVRATTTTNAKTYVAGNTGTTGNTGQYINYDANTQSLMGASAYGVYTTQPQVVYDDNGVAALSVAGSGGFMPTSVFQWFLLIILILAIVIIARMISKTFSNGSHGAPAH